MSDEEIEELKEQEREEREEREFDDYMRQIEKSLPGKLKVGAYYGDRDSRYSEGFSWKPDKVEASAIYVLIREMAIDQRRMADSLRTIAGELDQKK